MGNQSRIRPSRPSSPEFILDFILHDQMYQKCIRNALLSGSPIQKFGSLAVFNGDVIGEGFNRLVKPTDKIRQGYANHAEINALNDALNKGHKIEGCDLYISGFFAKERTLFIRTVNPQYTCKVCLPHLKKYNVSSLYLPTSEGWKPFSMAEAEESVRQFSSKSGNNHEKRVRDWKVPYTIDFWLQHRK